MLFSVDVNVVQCGCGLEEDNLLSALTNQHLFSLQDHQLSTFVLLITTFLTLVE
jgi:hypothetical protein